MKQHIYNFRLRSFIWYSADLTGLLLKKQPCPRLHRLEIYQSKHSVQSLRFKYHTDQTMCIILKKLSNPSILTIVLGAQKNHLQADGSRDHPWHFFIRIRKPPSN